jgi:hypothetical protein
MIEKLTKRRVQVETMLWDGTDERGYLIKAWVGRRTILVDGVAALANEEREDPAFVLPAEMTGWAAHALLWVAHNRDWCSLPVGYRVARELDGSGFYPLSPEGAVAGYEMPEETP